MNSRQKIFTIISVQIMIIVVSFLSLMILENERSIFSEIINVAGKNRYYSATIAHGISDYGITGNVSKVVSNLNAFEDNLNHLDILLQKELFGYYVIPARIFEQSAVITDNYSYVKTQILSDIEKGTITYSQKKYYDSILNDLITDSDQIATNITNTADELSFQIILLELILAIINVVTHVILAFMIIKTHKIQIKKEVELKTIRKNSDTLKKIDKQKDEFTAMITHELKTPLVPIRGYLDILLSKKLGPINEEQKKRLEIIKNSSQSLLDMLSDVLDIQKLEMKNFSFLYGDVKLSQVLADLKEYYRIMMDEHNLEFTIGEFDDVTLHTDHKRLEQALKILITNAMDFVQKEDGKIQLNIRSDKSTITFLITDNGIGIEDNVKKDIFKKFYQIDTSMTREHGGSGLGLAICNGLIQGLGGKVDVQSTVGKGSTFSVMIPLKHKN